MPHDPFSDLFPEDQGNVVGQQDPFADLFPEDRQLAVPKPDPYADLFPEDNIAGQSGVPQIVPSRATIGETVRAVGRGLKSAATAVFPSVIAQTIRGGEDIPLREEGGIGGFISGRQKAQQELQPTPEEAQKIVVPEIRVLGKQIAPPTTAQDVQAGIENLGYSGATLAGGMAIGAIKTPIQHPAAKVAGAAVGALALSGLVGYRSQKDAFLTNLRDYSLQINPNLTDAEWQKIRAASEKYAQSYGLWEAVPEAVGQATTAGLLRAPLAKQIVSAKWVTRLPYLKNIIAAKIASGAIKTSVDLASELATETETQYHQAAAEKAVGMRETAPTRAEAYSEVAPQVTVGTLATMGVGGATQSVINRIKPSAAREPLANAATAIQEAAAQAQGVSAPPPTAPEAGIPPPTPVETPEIAPMAIIRNPAQGREKLHRMGVSPDLTAKLGTDTVLEIVNDPIQLNQYVQQFGRGTPGEALPVVEPQPTPAAETGIPLGIAQIDRTRLQEGLDAGLPMDQAREVARITPAEPIAQPAQQQPTAPLQSTGEAGLTPPGPAIPPAAPVVAAQAPISAQPTPIQPSTPQGAAVEPGPLVPAIPAIAPQGRVEGQNLVKKPKRKGVVNAIQIQRATAEVPRNVEPGRNIAESGAGVRPGIRGQETAGAGRGAPGETAVAPATPQGAGAEITPAQAVMQGLAVRLPVGTLQVKATYKGGKTAVVSANSVDTLAGTGEIVKVAPLQAKGKALPGTIKVAKKELHWSQKPLNAPLTQKDWQDYRSEDKRMREGLRESAIAFIRSNPQEAERIITEREGRAKYEEYKLAAASEPIMAPASKAIAKIPTLTVMYGGRPIGKVKSFQEASEKWEAVRDAAHVQGNEMLPIELVDDNGNVLGHVAYNGRVFEGPAIYSSKTTHPRLLYEAIPNAQFKVAMHPQAGTRIAIPEPIPTPAVVPEKPTAQTAKVEVTPTAEGKTVAVPAADRTGLPAKEQKKYLLAELDKAIEGASKEDPTPRIPEPKHPFYKNTDERIAAENKRAEDNKKIAVRNKEKFGVVTIEVPGDGNFEILNSKKALADFRDRVRKAFPVTPPSIRQAVPKPVGPTPIVEVAPRPRSLEELKAVVEPMTSADETRGAIQEPHVDGDEHALVATDGRRIIVVLGVNGQTTKHAEGTYPNWVQVVPAYRKNQLPDISEMNIQAKISDSEKFIRQLRQAGGVAIAYKPFHVDLFLDPNGELFIAAVGGEVGQYQSGDLAGTKYIGTLDGNFLDDEITALRKLGNESVVLATVDERSPFVITGKREYVIQMPIRADVDMGKRYGVTLAKAKQEKPRKREKTAAPAKEVPAKNELRTMYLGEPLAPEAEREALAAPVLAVIRSLDTGGNSRDKAGFPNRASPIYQDALNGKFTVAQIAAARDTVARLGGSMTLTDALEGVKAWSISVPASTPAPEPASATVAKYGDIAPQENSVRVNIADLTPEVLARMNKIGKREGFDTRGNADLYEYLVTGRKLSDGSRLMPAIKDGVLIGDWADIYQEAIAGVSRRVEKQISKKVEQQQHPHINRARLRELGFTADLREAGYITPQGRLIDLSGKREGGTPGMRSYDHREAGGSMGMQEFMAEGNIRMDYNAGSVDIYAAPTTEQYDVMRRVAEDRNGEIIVEVQRGLGTKGDSYYLSDAVSWSQTYDPGTNPRKILNDIRNFYDQPRYGDITPFYSQLLRAIEAMPLKQAIPGDQMMNKVRGLPGVKAQEIEETGFADWLMMQKEQGRAVTKDAAMAFLRQNGVKVETIRKGETNIRYDVVENQDGEARTIHSFRTEREADDYIRENELDYADVEIRNSEASDYAEANLSATKYSQYAPPGGIPGTYRELLLTVPGETRRSIYEKTGKVVPYGEAAKLDYKSPHWEESNVIAHMLVDERRIPLDVLERTQPELAAKLRAAGKTEARALNMIEGQSDIHATGQAKGYNVGLSPEDRARLDVLEKMKGKEITNEELDEIQSLKEKERGEGMPPPLPFKGDAWKRLVIRKMLSEAAAGNYDLLTWSTGADRAAKWGSERVEWKKVDPSKSDEDFILEFQYQGDDKWTRVRGFDTESEAQAEMDKRQKIAKESPYQRRLNYRISETPSEPTWAVAGTEQSGGEHAGMNLEQAARERGILLEQKGQTVRTKDDLRKIVQGILRNPEAGKVDKLTDRIWARMQTEPEGTSMPRREFFEFLYDKSFVNEANDIVRKMDKTAKVTDAAIVARQRNMADFRDQHLRMYPDATDEDIEKAFAVYHESGTQIHAIPITAALRESVLQGQPLYADIQGGERQDETYRKYEHGIAPGRPDLSADGIRGDKGRGALWIQNQTRWQGQLDASIDSENRESDGRSSRLAGVQLSRDLAENLDFERHYATFQAQGVDLIPVTGGAWDGGVAIPASNIVLIKAGADIDYYAGHELAHILEHRQNAEVARLKSAIDTETSVFDDLSKQVFSKRMDWYVRQYPNEQDRKAAFASEYVAAYLGGMDEFAPLFAGVDANMIRATIKENIFNSVLREQPLYADIPIGEGGISETRQPSEAGNIEYPNAEGRMLFVRHNSGWQRKLDARIAKATRDGDGERWQGVALSRNLAASNAFRRLSVAANNLGIDVVPIRAVPWNGYADAATDTIYVAENESEFFVTEVGIHELSHILDARNNAAVRALIEDVDTSSAGFQKVYDEIMRRPGTEAIYRRMAAENLGFVPGKIILNPRQQQALIAEMQSIFRKEIVAAFVDGRPEYAAIFKDSEKAATTRMTLRSTIQGATVDYVDISPRESVRAVTPQQDAEYMAAVKAGDLAKAQRMVDEAIVESIYYKKDEATDDEYIGLRGDDVIVKKRFRASWNRPDGLRTTRLPGVSVVNVGYDNISKEKIARSLKRAIGYGRNIYLLAGTSPADVTDAYANDPGERIFVDHRILAVYKRSRVTRDAQGNVIPLSQRFNPSEADIRYGDIAPIAEPEFFDIVTRARSESYEKGKSETEADHMRYSRWYSPSGRIERERRIANLRERSPGTRKAWGEAIIDESFAGTNDGRNIANRVLRRNLVPIFVHAGDNGFRGCTYKGSVVINLDIATDPALTADHEITHYDLDAGDDRLVGLAKMIQVQPEQWDKYITIHKEINPQYDASALEKELRQEIAVRLTVGQMELQNISLFGMVDNPAAALNLITDYWKQGDWRRYDRGLRIGGEGINLEITPEAVVAQVEQRINAVRQAGEAQRAKIEDREERVTERYRIFAQARATIAQAIHMLAVAVSAETRQTMRASMAKAINELRKALPVAERGRWLTIGRLRLMDNPEKVTQFLQELDAHVEEYQRRELIAAIKKTFQRATESPSIAVDYIQRIRGMVTNLMFNKPSPATIADLRGTADWINRALLRGENVELPQKVFDALRKLSAKPMASMSVPELAVLHEQMRLLEQLGRLKYQAKQARYESEKKGIVADLAAGTVAMNDSDPVRVGIGEDKTIGQKVREMWRGAVDGLKNLYRTHMPIDAMVDILDGYQGFAGPNYRNFKARLDLAFGGYLGRMRSIEDELRDKIKQFNIDKRSSIRIGVYAALQQKNGEAKLLNNGYTEDELRQLALTPDEEQFYHWMRSRLDEIRPDIAETMREVDNKELDYEDNYFPFQTDWSLMEDEMLGNYIRDDNGILIKTEDHPRYKKEVEKGFTQKRKGAGRQKIRVDSVYTFLKHMSDASYYVSMGRDVKMMQEIAKSDEYGRIAGDAGQRLMIEWLDTMARKGGMAGAHVLRWLDNLRRNVGIGTLGFRLSSALIQPTSLLDAVGLIGHWAGKGAFDLASHREWREFVQANMPEVAARIGDDPSFLEFGSGWTMRQIRQAGYWPMQKLDMLTAASVGTGAYQKYLHDHNIVLDMETPNAEAIAYAQRIVRRTQASGQFKDVPLAISRGKWIGGSRSLTKAFYQFQTFILNKFSLVSHEGIRDSFERRLPMQAFNIFLWSQMAFMMEEMIRMGIRKARGRGDDDEEKYWRRVAMNNVQMIPFIGQTAQALQYSSVPAPAIEQISEAATGARSLATGKRSLTRVKGGVRAATAASTLAGIPGAGQVGQWIADIIPDKDRAATRIVDKYARRFNKAFPPTRGMYRALGRRAFGEARLAGAVKTVDENGKRISLQDQETRFMSKWRGALERYYGEDKWLKYSARLKET